MLQTDNLGSYYVRPCQNHWHVTCAVGDLMLSAFPTQESAQEVCDVLNSTDTTETHDEKWERALRVVTAQEEDRTP